MLDTHKKYIYMVEGEITKKKTVLIHQNGSYLTPHFTIFFF